MHHAPEAAPAIPAMLAGPARPRNFPDLVNLCSTSRATFVARSDKPRRPSVDRLAANERKKSTMTGYTVVKPVGQESVAGFRHVLADRI